MEHTGNSDNGYSFRYSPDSSSPAVDIVEAVAWVKGVEPDELKPLTDFVDPDALNNLFNDEPGENDFYRGSTQTEEETPYVEFSYENCVIIIRGSGRFTVKPDE